MALKNGYLINIVIDRNSKNKFPGTFKNKIMNLKLAKPAALHLKALIVITCTIIGVVSFTNCEAQSVVGKWKRAATNWFTIDKSTSKLTPGSAQYKQQFDKNEEQVSRDCFLCCRGLLRMGF